MMLQMILMLGLTGAQLSKTQTAQVQPCKWPNTCKQSQVVQIQVCTWPNKCEIGGATVTEAESSVTTCDFPHKCRA